MDPGRIIKEPGSSAFSDVTQGSRLLALIDFITLPHFIALVVFCQISTVFFLAIMSNHETDSEESYESDDSDINFIPGYIMECPELGNALSIPCAVPQYINLNDYSLLLTLN